MTSKKSSRKNDKGKERVNCKRVQPTAHNSKAKQIHKEQNQKEGPCSTSSTPCTPTRLNDGEQSSQLAELNPIHREFGEGDALLGKIKASFREHDDGGKSCIH